MLNLPLRRDHDVGPSHTKLASRSPVFWLISRKERHTYLADRTYPQNVVLTNDLVNAFDIVNEQARYLGRFRDRRVRDAVVLTLCSAAGSTAGKVRSTSTGCPPARDESPALSFSFRSRLLGRHKSPQVARHKAEQAVQRMPPHPWCLWWPFRMPLLNLLPLARPETCKYTSP
jgi:hypothetical protein